MKITVILICFFKVISSVNCNNEVKPSHGLIRNKRQDDRWTWGSETTTEQALLRQSIENATKETPCTKFENYDPPQPDFKTGRRKSEEKCLEYIWKMKTNLIRDDLSWNSTIYGLKLTKFSGTVYNLTMHPMSKYFAIGGRDTSHGEFPHMGAIGWKAAVGTWVFKCGSSLISPKFILTAAHCTRASSLDTTIADPVPKIVRLGDKNILDFIKYSKNPHDANIKQIIVHPQYSAPKKYFDIALMELQKNVVLGFLIQPACLWSKPDTSSLGTKATLTGWGVVETGGRKTSPELQAADVDIIDPETCNNFLLPSCNRHWCGIQEHQLCAGKLAGGVDACQGDSGGPLQVRIPFPKDVQSYYPGIHYVIGVTSFGIGCAQENLPGIYTRVSSFIDWIESIVWK